MATKKVKKGVGVNSVALRARGVGRLNVRTLESHLPSFYHGRSVPDTGISLPI